jgi:hypothetical protein
MNTKQKALTKNYNAIMKKLLIAQMTKKLQYNDYLKKSQRITTQFQFLIENVK